ncbi:DUF1456 family protein [Rossellomorea sp. SC111]|uniref:DUF1456 family protein n=1 Tax=Rossellomorea sp. SC111 TaxID=2968985 RepID=UPI00215B06B4|nr:DUF1456 family protein [Rossellomorea sp. SC111]MCR8847536.1 DUF1456 family protein [Rossellomorea sp. SC111]
MNIDNNDILIRLRYALDLKNTEMVDIFKIGGIELSKDEVLKVLTKSMGEEELEEGKNEEDDHIPCDDEMFESFLNGFITFKRGKQEPKPGQTDKPEITHEHVNNLLLKKVKIALSLTSEDMIEILELADVHITKGELGAILRREGHKNYRICGDRYARNFLKGLAIRYRG